MRILKRLFGPASIRDLERSRDAPGLVRVLAKDPDPRRRASAATVLGELRDARGTKPLMDALKDGDPTVRRRAAQALASVGDTASVEDLVHVLTADTNWRVRREAALALGLLRDPRAVDSLIRGLNDREGLDEMAREVERARREVEGARLDGDYVAPQTLQEYVARDPLVASCCSEALRKIGLPAGGALMACLASDDNSLRLEEAVGLLCEIDPTGALEPLISMLKHTSGAQRWVAARGLRRLRDSRSLEPLLALLDRELPEAHTDRPEELRHGYAIAGNIHRSVATAAVSALIELHDARAVPALVGYARELDVRSLDLNDLTAELRRFPRAAVESLLAELDSQDEEHRNWATDVLSGIADASVTQRLVAQLGSPSPGTRESVARILGSTGDAAAVESIIPLLMDGTPSVRRSAAEALGHLGDVRALPALSGVLADPKHTVRESARLAIDTITKRSSGRL